MALRRRSCTCKGKVDEFSNLGQLEPGTDDRRFGGDEHRRGHDRVDYFFERAEYLVGAAEAHAEAIDGRRGDVGR